jgi:hypothetical protein
MRTSEQHHNHNHAAREWSFARHAPSPEVQWTLHTALLPTIFQFGVASLGAWAQAGRVSKAWNNASHEPTAMRYLRVRYTGNDENDDDIIDGISRLTGLHHLDMLWSPDRVAKQVAMLKNLTRLASLRVKGEDLANRYLNNDTLKSLAVVLSPHITRLVLEGLGENVTWDCLNNCLAGKKLVALHLVDCRITDTGADDGLCELLTLTKCTLDNCTTINDAHLSALAHMPALTSLNLVALPLVTGAYLEEVCKNMPHLTALSHADCGSIENNIISKVLETQKSLTSLNLQSCYTNTDKETTKRIFALPKLKHLNLSNNTTLRGNFLANIEHLLENGVGFGLLSLDISRNEFINAASLEGLARYMPALTALSLRWCPNVNDAALLNLKPLVALTTLDLAFCRGFNDTGLQNLASLAALTTLNLEGCKPRNGPITNTGLAHLATMKTLTSLNLSWCYGISEGCSKSFVSMAALTTLNINCCKQTTDMVLKDIATMNTLTSLNLRGCKQITNTGLVDLATMTTLTSLDLSLCPHITNDGLAKLVTKSSALQSLDLRGNTKLTKDGIFELKSLPMLTSLNLTGCIGTTPEDRTALRKELNKLRPAKVEYYNLQPHYYY